MQTRPWTEGELPVPRIQFRWVKNEDPENRHRYGWKAHYEWVLPLRDIDIRRTDVGLTELVIPIPHTGTLLGGSEVSPTTTPPFRDGCHAKWDREAIGANECTMAIFVQDGAGGWHVLREGAAAEAFDPKPIFSASSQQPEDR